MVINKKVNFFIVGFPRCGTTFMYHYLSLHPEISMSKLKEPNYFLSKPYKRIKTLNDYKKQFKPNKINGDASAIYILNKKSLLNIRKYNQNAKILIMTRNKKKMIESYYKVISSLGEKPELNWRYIECFRMEEHLKECKEIFENIKVIKLERIKKNPKKVYKEVLKFLKVDSSFLPEEKFKIINKQKEPYVMFIPAMMHFFAYRNIIVKSIIRTIFPLALRNKIRKLNNNYYVSSE